MTGAAPVLTRPKGFPVGFRLVMACWLLVAGLIPHALLVAFDVLQGAEGSVQDAGLPFAFGANIVLLGGFFIVSGAGPGRIRAFWTACYAMAAVWAGVSLLAAAALIRGAPTPGRRGMADLLGVICVLLLAALVPLFLRLRRLHWMDPASRPDQWEPVMISRSALARSFRRDEQR